MKFLIRRTSTWFDSKPHPKAIEVQATKCNDVRAFKSKKEQLERFPGDAKDAIEWGTIKSNGKRWTCRTLKLSPPKTLWIIEINSLEELIELTNECPIILDSVNYYKYPEYPYLIIEIYDGFRE